MTRHPFLGEQRGGAGTELALMLPLLLVLLFTGLEAGHFIWTQHKLTVAVRDGARYASRLDVADVCPTLNADAIARIKLLTRTGQLADTAAKSLVPGWTADQITVTPYCGAFVATGIYTELDGEKAPLVTIEAKDVAYPFLFGSMVGFSGVKLNAHSNTAVIGL